MQPIFREWHRAWLARRNGSHCSEKPTLYNGGWCYSGSCRLLWPYFLLLPFSSCLSSSSQRGLSWPFTGSFLYPHHPLNILFYILLRIHPSLQFFLSFFLSLLSMSPSGMEAPGEVVFVWLSHYFPGTWNRDYNV